MHIIEPARYKKRPNRRRRWPYALLPVVVVVGAGAANWLRPLPAVRMTIQLSVPAAAEPDIQWPADGQAAVAAGQYGPLGSFGDQTPLATASVAKVITALCVLQKEPLAIGQAGPSYIVGASDVQFYENYAANGGSLLPVQTGEQLTEYQALEALMIPSANNIADSLVRWVFDSQSAYAAYATTFLQQHGLNNTHIGSDASGFDPSTTSTVSDLAQLGLLASKNPALMELAREHSVTLPLAGTVDNYNTVLGQSGITGLKTGNNAADPGAFLFTATTHIGSTIIPVSGAVMGATDLGTALQESVRLAGSVEQSFEQVRLASAGQSLGIARTAWSASAPIISVGTIRLVRWKATPITTKYQVHTDRRGGIVGLLRVTAGPVHSEAELKLAHPLAPPTFWWRLTRR